MIPRRSRHTVKYLRISEDNRTFIYEDPPDKKGFGSHESKSVHLKNVTSVAPYDAAKPQMLKFKAGHKEYEFNCEWRCRTRLLASRGRALGRLEQPRRRRAPDALIGLRTQARASTSAPYWLLV